MTIPVLFEQIAKQYPDNTAQLIRHDDGSFSPRTWRELRAEVDAFAAGLLALGIVRGDRIGLISENRAEWFVADLAILSVGAIDVPRGTDATDPELEFILSYSETATVVVEHARQLDRLLAIAGEIKSLRRLIVLDDDVTTERKVPRRVEVFRYSEVTDTGRKRLADTPQRVSTERQEGQEDDTATIIFTSGTTGEPKGVMLSHRNFLHQVRHVPDLIDVSSDDIWLCVLPVWHSFERIMQYVAMGRGSALAYSKPIGHIMLADFQTVRPTWMASVPRIWEAVRAGIYRNVAKQSPISRSLFHFFVAVGATHARLVALFRGRVPRFTPRNRLLDAALAAVPLLLLKPLYGLGSLLVFRKIRGRLGGRFMAGISGGGALPGAVDSFFSAVGILLLEGYGLTETAPVLAVRAQKHPVANTVGPVFPGTEIRIVAEDGSALPPGERGLVYARGPQVMKGYYRRDDLTAAILSQDGWLNTGDLGMLTYDNELKITGRAKDTIVLSGGENVEPAPIEERIRESPYIAQAMVVGQDRKFLGALIVPDFDACDDWAAARGRQFASRDDMVADEEFHHMIHTEITSRVNQSTGFKSFEQIARIVLVAEDFQVGDELSAKQEIKRHVVADRYGDRIATIYA